jgi:hypothetical protein
MKRRATRVDVNVLISDLHILHPAKKHQTDLLET